MFKPLVRISMPSVSGSCVYAVSSVRLRSMTRNITREQKEIKRRHIFFEQVRKRPNLCAEIVDKNFNSMKNI